MSEIKILCKNCNSNLTGDYCSECGQAVKDMNLSFFSFIKEFTGNLFSLDSKIFLTLNYLIAKPGYLSTEYVVGKRMTFTLPSRLYLFTSIFVIALFSLIQQDSTRYMKFSTEPIGFFIAEHEDGSGAKYRVGGYGGQPHFTWEKINSFPIKINILSFLSKGFMILFPIFALLLKCFYWKRLYINHLILVLHNHSFLLIIIAILYLLIILFDMLGLDIINIYTIILIWFVISIYFYLSSLKFYKDGKFITLIKYVVLSISYFIIMIISNISIAALFFYFPKLFN